MEAYSMLLGRPWLKLAKVHHNWGDSTFIITLGEGIVMLSTMKRININSSLQLKNLIGKKDCHNEKRNNFIM